MTDDREPFREARLAGKAKHHEQRLENATYTAAEVKVLTEAALRLGRKEAMEEFAATCGRRAQLAERVPEPMRSGVREGMIVTWLAAQRLAEDGAYLATPGATSGRTDPSRYSDLPQDSQAALRACGCTFETSHIYGCPTGGGRITGGTS